jgi:hypothetical protein
LLGREAVDDAYDKRNDNKAIQYLLTSLAGKNSIKKLLIARRASRKTFVGE